MKKILDSVHGYISVDDDYIKNIVDTDYFQRLRRIEQTSTRSIFPSARHDRFIHSLGVFHLGCKFLNTIKTGIEQLNESQRPKDSEVVYESYKLACLLHDVAHSPYSHTFEKYFDNQWSDLKGTLCKLVDNNTFKDDWENQADPSAPHERMSAIVALGAFGDFLNQKNADQELVARMIIGLKYRNNDNYSFRNAMIDLIHGDVIDADGLDYVCRDAWASGYCTTSVDIERLVDSVRIQPDKRNIFHLCFTAKCLNEIEAVLKVKTFQQSFVINHHTVTYEQALLVKAMESAALYHYNDEKNCEDKRKRKEALQKLCCIDSFFKNGGEPEHITDHTKINIVLPMDDDFISLMKYIKDDKYVSQWLKRQYKLQPLWKSKADFYQRFSHLRNCSLTKDSWIFHDECKQFICKTFNIVESDVFIQRATPKYKENFAKKVELLVNDEIIKYSDLFPEDIHSYEPPKSEFYYIYVPKDKDKNKIIEAICEETKKYFFSR